MSLYLGCRVKDEGGIDTELESGLCSGLGRLGKCDNNLEGDEEGLNRAEWWNQRRHSGLEKSFKVCRTG